MSTALVVRTGRLARVSGVAGIGANLFLILFFALSQPWRWAPNGFSWLGPVNDVLVIVQFAALLPVALRLGARLARAVGGLVMGAIAVLQVGLVVGLIPFDVQWVLVTACTPVLFGWLLAVCARGALPRTVARFGITVAVSYLAGALVVAVALVNDSTPFLVIGGAIGLFGWLGFPVWPLLLAHEEER